MYPSDDIPVMLGLTAFRARALQQDIAAQLARIRTLYERAESVRGHADPQQRSKLIHQIHETVRTSHELVETAREHGRRSRLLVQRSRDRRLIRAGGEAV
jgi:nitrogen-specific signal transduction histidine kinase